MKNSKKFIIVLKGYPRLSETFISQEILSLQKRGFDFEIASLRHPTDKKVHPVNKEITAPVTYLPEYLYQQPWRVLRAWWQVRKTRGYKKAWREFFSDLKRDFTSNRFRRFGQAMVLAHEFGGKAGSFYAHFLHTPTSVTRYAALMLKKPFAISAHAKDIWTSPDWEITEKLADCSWLATCTNGAADHLKNLADNPEKIHLIYHGLDLRRFPPVSRKSDNCDGTASDKKVQLLSVGRAVEKKGLDTLISALAKLPKACHWHWTHIGGGPLRDTLMKQAQDLGIEEKCSFLGALDQRDVIEAYARSHFFVLPCRIDETGDRDGLPNVIVEAQSQGLAVISSEISGIPELLEDGVNGLFALPNDAEDLCGKLIEMISNPALRHEMGEAGQAKVRRALDHEETIGQLADLIQSLQDAGRQS